MLPDLLPFCSTATPYELPALLLPAHWTVPGLSLLIWERKAKNLSSHSCPSKWSSWSAVPRVGEGTEVLLTSRTWRNGWPRLPEGSSRAQAPGACDRPHSGKSCASLELLKGTGVRDFPSFEKQMTVPTSSEVFLFKFFSVLLPFKQITFIGLSSCLYSVSL